MKEYDDGSMNIDVENKDVPYKRERPLFKHSMKRKNYSKNILEEPDSSTLIELTTKDSSNQNKLNFQKKKSNTIYMKSVLDEKYTENLILENKKKLTRLTKKTYYDKSKINLTPEQKQYKVNIIKRNYDNNIYINNIDQSISFVIPYKYKCSIYMFIFLGIPYIITKLSNRKLIEWRGEPCRVSEADFYLIVDGYGNYHICNFNKKSFNPNFNAENRIKGYDNKYISTLFSSIEIYNRSEYHEIFYVYNKYYCYKKNREDNLKKNLNESFNDVISSQQMSVSNDTITQTNRYNKDYYFESQIFNMSFTTNKEIYNIFNKNFMKQKEIQFQLDIYGPNKLILKNINYLKILLEKIFSFVTIYILFIIIFYWLENYYYFIFVLIISIILIIITTYQKYLNQKKVVDFSLNKQEKITVYEGPNNPPRLLDYENLVPGQIIKLKEQDILQCDCLLLEGFCSCIESSLTGESSSIMKYKLPKNNANFIYSENMKSYLFCGTKIENCFPKELKALVIGTGFNTQRGNLIQSVLVPRKSNYNFYKENITFFIFTLVFFIVGSIIFSILHNRKENNSNIGGNLFENILDLLAMAIPCSLPLTLTLGTFYYQYSLINKQISCSGVYRLMAAGKINKLIFDKTGTLTEEDLELHGYISSIKKDGYLILDSREKTSKLYLSNLSEYYKNEFHNKILEQNSIPKDKNDIMLDIKNKTDDNNSEKDEQLKKDDTDNTITFFMECLATCHSVTKINDENKGNSIDIKIFNEVNWIYDPLNINSNSNDQFEVKPKKYFKITEEQFFMKNKNMNINSISQNDKLNSYKLKVIYRSHFESRNQSMSVIVKNNFNESIRLYIKGAPEKIIKQCLDYSIPLNYDEIHRKYTLQGYRVLACATKLISDNSENEEEIISNEDYQNYKKNDLIFLGLILFQNKIKTHTKKVLQKLKNDGLFPIISTGDNAFTSISLVKECNLVKDNSKFCIMEMDSSNLNLGEKKTKLFNNESLISKHCFIQCTLEEVNYNKPSKNNSETFTVVLNDKIEPNDYEIFKRNNHRSKCTNLLNIGEFNNKILKENDMKLCIQSQVFDFIFFRNKEGLNDNNNRESISEGNINVNKEEELNLLRQIIVDRGILFFRMSPDDKTKLIQLFKKQNPNNIVAMCGDGANDCSALISADVGISLKSRENIIMTSHLMAKTKSIAVINDIINIGKACYENSTIILKILLIYSEIKITSRCLLKIYNDNLSKSQCFYLDCIIILFGCCLMSFSDPNYKMKDQTFSKIFISKLYLISIIGHSIIQLGLLIIYFFCIIEKEKYYFEDENSSKGKQRSLYSDDKTALNSYIFYFNSSQCLSMVFLLNYFSKCKQSVFKSRIFIIYIIFVFIILSEILSLGNFDVGLFKVDLVKFVKLNSEGTNSQYSRLILIAFCIGDFFLTMALELSLNWIISWNYRKYLQVEEEIINKKNKSNYRQKSIFNIR